MTRIMFLRLSVQEAQLIEALWWLRDRLDPFASVGGTTGFDVILKIYDLLLEAKSLDLQEELGLPPLAPDKEEQDSESRDEDTTKDGTEDKTEDTTEASRTDGHNQRRNRRQNRRHHRSQQNRRNRKSTRYGD